MLFPSKPWVIEPIQQLVDQAAMVQEHYGPKILYKWLFAHEGLTDDALALAQQEGVFWSTREQLDDLLTYLGLRKLPNI